jgi:hypothetical protein
MLLGSLTKWSNGSPISLVWIKILPIAASSKILENEVRMAPPARTISTPHSVADNSKPLYS